MTISASDIKIFASERMTDNPDGGGRRTATAVTDGAVGAIFPKVSRADAVRGRVNLRKIYPGVDTADLDVYAGAMFALTEAPANARIAISHFSTASDFDTRAQARDRVESYVIAGPESRMTLYGRQLVGQGAILVYQRPEAPIVDVGTVLCLSAESGGTVTAQQFVRVADVSHEERTVTDGSGDFTIRAVTITLSAPLRTEFAGPDAPSRSTAVTKPALVRQTTVADASRYRSITRLVQDAEASDLTLRVQSVYTPLVPSTQRESPVSNLPMPGASALRRGRANAVTAQTIMEQYIAPPATSWTIRLKRPAAAGTVVLTINGYSTGSCVYTDNGAGRLVAPLSRPSVYPASWPIDYTTGIVSASVASIPSPGYGVTGTWVPASPQSETQHTDAIAVTLATRGTVVVRTLRPVPAPGTLVLAYRALGRWYELRDDGAGGLAGDTGSGTIDYVSGALIATLGALPDVGSSIALAWGTSVQYEAVTNNAAAEAEIWLDLPDLPAAPDSLALSWTSGGAARSATDNASGVLSGHCTGEVNYTTGRARLVFASYVPDAGTNIVASYNQLTPSGATPTVVSASVNVASPASFTLADSAAGSAGSISLTARVSVTIRDAVVVYTVRLMDNGSGVLVTAGGAAEPVDPPVTGGEHPKALVAAGQTAGTITYATGAVVLSGAVNLTMAVFQDRWFAANVYGVVTTGEQSCPWASGVYTYSLRTGAASTNTARTYTVAAGATAARLRLRLLTTVAKTIAPGSLWFQIRPPATIVSEADYGTGGDLVDDGSGGLVLRPDLLGSGISAGTVDYTTATALLTTWPASAAALNLVVQSLLCTHGLSPTDAVTFRTPGAPLRPASFLVQATATDGTLLTAVADQSGTLTATDVTGTVQQEMGVATVRFGRMVTAAGNEAQPWYDADLVEGGLIWRPKPVIPASVRFSAVVLTNLPMDADLLGLDPVRLPADGRVPTLRAGDLVLIASTQTTTLPNPAVAATTYSLGRTNLDFARVIDANGAPVAGTHYTINLAAGSITMAGALDLTGVAQPLRVKHRLEELQQLTDAQIDGQISLSAPLSRDYDADDTTVAAVFEAGDVVARAFGLFDQNSWLDTWADTVQGSGATAQYNDLAYPVEVLNDGAVTERWRINFTTTTAFQVIGENLGVIATGTTSADLQPVNPVTSEPYFTLRAAGWGSGWSAGNQLRFNTRAAGWPLWVVRTVLPGASVSGDAFDTVTRGDVD